MSTQADHESAMDGRVWPRRCRTTRWSIVLAATSDGESAQAAVGELYRAYFYPVYAFIASRRGREAAEELTQAFFFERMLDKKDLAKFDPSKCRRFRSWLFTTVDTFLKTRWIAERRKCRDVRKTLALDFDAAEIRFLREPQNDPERRFNRGWALCVLSTVIARLRVEYCAWSRRSGAATAPGDRFDKLKVFLPGPELEEPAYRAVAVALETTANAIKRRVFQLRERFGELLREHLAELVGSDEEVESELRFLYEALELPASCYELHRQ